MAPLKDGQTATAAEIAELLDVTTRRVQQLAKEGIIPRAGRGRYPLAGAVQGYVRYLRELLEEREEQAADSELDAARARKVVAEAELAEFALARARGQLLSLDDWERELSAALNRLRAKLQNLPPKWAPSLVGRRTIAEVLQVLEQSVAEAMGSLSETGEEDDDTLAAA